jgi:transposase
MVYREVTRVETKEVLRQWVGGAGCKRISARLGLDVKTVRRYVHAAQALGLTPASGEAALTDELLTALLSSMRTQAGRPRGEAWERCQAHRDRIKQLLAQGLRLSKLRKLLLRQGVQVPYCPKSKAKRVTLLHDDSSSTSRRVAGAV